MCDSIPAIKKGVNLQEAGKISAVWQFVFHVIVIYASVEYCVPWLTWEIYHHVPTVLWHDPEQANFWQFFFSNLMTISFVCGLSAGLVNARFLSHPIVRLVWVFPAVILIIAFLFTAPGIYPTMILQSDFGMAFHYAFGGGFKIPYEIHTYRDLWKAFIEIPDLMRGYYQLRFTAPACAGIAYSFGAHLSLRMRSFDRRRSDTDESDH